MIRQCAFTGDNRLLKGALHSHTTRSDGKCTPEEVVRQHEENGYDFLAITDHRNYNYDSFGARTLTIIPAMETDRRFTGSLEPWCSHCYHSVCLGPEDRTRNGYAQDEKPEGGFVSGQAEFQQVLDEVHAKGNITMLCHPEWSCLYARDFDRFEGIWAMELWNSGCALEDGIDTDNGHLWDDMLMQGKGWFGVAVDDGHNDKQNCLGWVMVNSENSVDDILAALQRGAFYSSCGPVIRDFYVDDENKAHIACSECERVQFYCGITRCTKIQAAEGSVLTDAQAPVNGHAFYVRAVVTDREGRKAWTNPIFLHK